VRVDSRAIPNESQSQDAVRKGACCRWRGARPESIEERQVAYDCPSEVDGGTPGCFSYLRILEDFKFLYDQVRGARVHLTSGF
jgi:hypothetical protein